METKKALYCTTCKSVFNKGLKQDYCPSCNYYSIEELPNAPVSDDEIFTILEGFAKDMMIAEEDKEYEKSINETIQAIHNLVYGEKKEESKLQKSYRLLKKYLDETPKEEIQKLINEVDILELPGITWKEYFKKMNEPYK